MPLKTCEISICCPEITLTFIELVFIMNFSEIPEVKM